MPEFFLLSINTFEKNTLIKMTLFTDIINTSRLPNTYSILEEFLPSIFRAKCYNYERLPFSQELKNTEIGHLFEHILLEYLCKLRIKRGCRNVEFSGVTKWNWRKDPRGTFHIKINSGLDISDILPMAIKKSSDLLKIVMWDSLIPLHTPVQKEIFLLHSSLFINRPQTDFLVSPILKRRLF